MEFGGYIMPRANMGYTATVYTDMETVPAKIIVPEYYLINPALEETTFKQPKVDFTKKRKRKIIIEEGE
jgi:hypothetical protein